MPPGASDGIGGPRPWRAAAVALVLSAAVAAGVLLVAPSSSRPPDGASGPLVLSSRATVAAIPAQGGEARRLGPAGPFVFISRPRPSPDGRSIVLGGQRCHACAPRLGVAPLAGGRFRPLFAPAGEPDWSPDGRSIVFIYSTPRNARKGLLIYRIGRDGRRPTEVEVGPEEPDEGSPVFHNPTYSPSGGLLAYDTETEPKEVEQVLLLDLGTGEGRALTRGATSAAQPAFSPDGRVIAYACELTTGSSDICLIGVDGRGARTLVGTAGDDRSPAFSPDGRTVVFESDVADRRAGIRSLYAVDRDGRGLRRLTSGFDASQPAFTPDGAQIVFVRRAIEQAP